MSLDQVQQKALQTYNENLEFFKQNYPDIYKNLELYAAAIDMGQVKPQFELQFLNTHFDIVNPNTKQFLYTQNSNEVSQKIADDISFDATVNSFKTYYEFNYNDTIAKSALEQDILAPYTIGNAPIVNFVNKNLPNPQNLKEIHKFIIFGVLLGIHIPLIHKKLNSKAYLIVEPNLEFFRLSLFVTNYANLAKQTKLFFSIAQNEYEFKKTFDSFYGELFIFNHYLKFVNLSAGSDTYMKVIQNFLVSQAHLLYSYDRTFLSISRTNSYISQNFKLLNIKYKQNIQPFEKPVLFLAAGPSLQHSIEFVKEKQEHFTIVAIYATMPILEKNGIKPDIITQYDEQDQAVLNTLDKINNIKFFDDTIFIFASHVNAKLMNSFPKENIFIFQAMFELKENFGILTSPSIGELTYALLLLFQAKELYLLGLDFAMDVESGSTHIEGHSGSGAFNKLKELEDSSDKNYSFRKNTIMVKGNFLPEVKSVPVFKTNIDTFAQFTEMYKDSTYNVYNLSNGAYLSGATPLKIEDIDLSDFIKNDKSNLKNELFDAFVNISEKGYNQKDLDKLNLKLSGVKKIKKNLDLFQKIKKYKDFEEYKGQLINLIQNILFEKNHCDDLQSILINFSSHNLHHIFYLFDLDDENDKKKYIYEVNKNLLTQLNKIVDTYVITISYSSDENSLALKKLNKYLKEYSIKNSIYSEPFFKELVETSNRGIQYDFKPNSIGFFAIEDNLSNKDFIAYVKELLKRFPELELKLFYFFDFQKVQAKYIFKQEQKRVEILIPHNIFSITSSVELWLETYDNTINVKKIDDIILNNYDNIYSAMFKKDAISNEEKDRTIPEKFTLANSIKNNFALPNTSYFDFANSLKDDFDDELLRIKYLKDHIGFFALKENLQQEFIKHISDMCNKFPNLKFSVFYFDEEIVQEFIHIFRNAITRFTFRIPKNISEILENSEIWVQAVIKDQSFLHNKIFQFINKTTNIYHLTLNDEYSIKEDSSNYLEALIESYEEVAFVKTLNGQLDENRLQNTNPENNIGFLATEDNLEDKEFIKLMTILFEKDYELRYKAFYFNEKQKNLVLNLFEKYLDKIDFIIPSTIYKIVENISIYIYSFVSYKNPKSLNYNKFWKSLNQTKKTLLVNLKNDIKDKNKFYYNLDLIYNSKIALENPQLLKVLENHPDYNKFNFINSLNLSSSNNYSDYSKNSIGFLIDYDNLKNGLINYINTLNVKFPNFEYKAFYFNDKEKSELNKLLPTNKVKLMQITSIDDIIEQCSIFIACEVFVNIDLYCIKNKITNIYVHRFRENMYGENPNLTIREFESNYDKNYFLFRNNDYFNLTSEEIEKSDYSITKLKINYIFKNMEIKYTIDLNENVHDFYNFKLLEILNQYPMVKSNYVKLIYKIYKFLKVI